MARALSATGAGSRAKSGAFTTNEPTRAMRSARWFRARHGPTDRALPLSMPGLTPRLDGNAFKVPAQTRPDMSRHVSFRNGRRRPPTTERAPPKSRND